MDNYEPIGAWEEETDLSSVVTLTPPQGDIDAIHICVEDQSVRLTYNGTTTPTATLGALYAAGANILLDVRPDKSVKLIEATASAKIGYQWLRLRRAT